MGVMTLSGGVIVNIINLTGSRIIYPMCLPIMEYLDWVKKAHFKYVWYHSVGGDMRLTKKKKGNLGTVFISLSFLTEDDV